MTYYTKEQEFMATLGKTINTLRKAHGFTQEELALMLGISAQAVSKWENDMSCPDIMLLPKIAQIFDITVDSLLSGDVSDKVTASAETEKENSVDATKEEKTAEAKKGLQIKKLHIAITNEGKTKNIVVPVGIVGFGLNLGRIFGAFNKTQADDIERSVREGIYGEILSVDGENGEHITISLE